MKKSITALRAAMAGTAILVLSTTASGAYPAQGSFDGLYDFKAADFIYNSIDHIGTAYFNTLDGAFNAEFQFEIATEDGVTYVKHLFQKGFYRGDEIPATYDGATGTLQLDSNVIYPYDTRISTIYLGMAPGGVWIGVDQGLVTLQLDEQGNISFPDFDIIAYNKNIGTPENPEYPIIASYKNITVTKGTATEEETPGQEGEIFADPGIEGVWSFNTNDPYFELDMQTISYNAYLEGNKVIFQEIAENGGEGTYHLVGRFTSPTTIRFEKTRVGPEATFTLYQIPFVNRTLTIDLDELDEEPFDATYDPVGKTIRFPSGSGIKYANFTTFGTMYTNWIAAFDFLSAERTGDFQPAVTISGLKVETSGNQSLISFDIATELFDMLWAHSWKAVVTERFGEIDHEDENPAPVPTETHIMDLDVNLNKGRILLTDLTEGPHVYSVYIIAYDADGKELVTSNSKDFTTEVGTFLLLNGVDAMVAEKVGIVITFDVTPYSMDITKAASWEAIVRETSGTSIMKLPVSMRIITNSVRTFGEGTLVINALSKGDHELGLHLSAYDRSGNLLASTTNESFAYVYLEDDFSNGVESVMEDEGPAVYYNLQGVRIAAPAPGEIVIKVQGGKSTKGVLFN